MSFVYATRSEAGVKQKNEDAVYAHVKKIDGREVFVSAVCDGMGGGIRGEHASQSMINAVRKWEEDELDRVLGVPEDVMDRRTLIRTSMTLLCNRVSSELYEIKKTAKKVCGTTLVLLLIVDGTYYFCNVGDSRIYLFRKHFFQITKDQTFVQQLVDEGKLDPKDMETHKDSNLLLQCIGAGREVVPELKDGPVYDDDIFLLCSDGFRHRITPEEIEVGFTEEDMTHRENQDSVLSYLCSEAIKRKEGDNLSVVTCFVGPRR